MSLETVHAKVGGDSGASNEPWATGHEQSTQASTATLRAATTHQAPSHWTSQWRYLPILAESTNEGGKGRGKKQNNRTLAAWNKQHLTQQKRPARTIRETLYVYIIDQARGQDGWILAEFSFCVFMDRDEVEVYKNVKRERGQYPAILTEVAWSIKDLLYGI